MDPYLLIIILMIAIPTIAQINISRSYSKYQKILNNKSISGCEVARKILDANNLNDVHIIETRGNLSDHYDPKRKVVRLSSAVFHGESIASVAVAAHECGHAIQDKEKYSFLRIRTAMVPIVNICSYLGYIMIIISFLLSTMDMFWTAIGLMSFTILFQFITLPVEFNASSRAETQLQKINLITSDELEGTRNVLNAAALTYVAALLTSILEILRLVMYASNDR